MQHVLVAPFHQGEQHQRRDTAVTGADGRPALMLGWAHPLTQMSGFFTKAALMTFGGRMPSCLRLPGAVTHYGWLTAGQMMDGLALGESTPDR